MTAAEFLASVLTPGLAWVEQTLGPKPPASPEAKVMLLAIAGQEAAWTYREQKGGPAEGYWQFESGGVGGLFTAHSTIAMATRLAIAAKVPPHAPDVYHALAINNDLATGFARLLLWSDPRPLPAVGDVQKCYEMYLNNWRPGKPHAKDWPAIYKQALDAIQRSDQAPRVSA